MIKNKQQRILELTNKIEDNLPVDRWVIKGVHVWPLIRIPLAFELFILEDFNSNNQVTRYKSILPKVLKIIKTVLESVKVFITDFKHNDFNSKQKDVIFFISSSTRFFKAEDRWYNPYCDSLIKFVEERNLTYQCFEQTADYQYRVPRFRKSTFLQLRFFYYSFVSYVKSRLVKSPFTQLEGIDKLEKMIAEEFPSYQMFNHKIFNYRLELFAKYKKYFLRKLRKIKPSVTFNDGYYCIEVMAFISACKELNIQTVELQHGVQGAYHLAYRNWKKIPENGYEMLPDIFWSWSELEKNYIDQWAKYSNGKHQAIIGGNPCLVIYDQKGYNIINDYNTRIRNIVNKTPENINVLFTVQSFFELPDFLLNAINQSTNCNWWIRVHPQYSETRESIRAQFTNSAASVLIDEASDIPMVALLNNMNIHMTEFSSSVLEAFTLGIPSVVINERAVNLFKDIIDKGMCIYADNSQGILQGINHFRNTKSVPADPEQILINGFSQLDTILKGTSG